MLKLQYFGHLMRKTGSLEKILMLRKTEGGRRRGQDRWWDGWMASLTRWTWVWASSGSWWWTGKSGVLQSMGLHRVGQDWWPNWTELKACLVVTIGEAILLPSSGWRSVMLLNIPQCTQHSPLQQSHPDQNLNSVEFGKLSIGLKGLPKCLNGKESICQCRRCRFDPWVKKIPWRRKWQPTPLFLPGISHGQRSLVSYSLWSGRDGHDKQFSMDPGTY